MPEDRLRDAAVTVYVADNPNGSDHYDFAIVFRPLGVAAELRLRARIEGSDEWTITPEVAQWRMLGWGWPHSVKLGEACA